MNPRDVLRDAFERVGEVAERAVEGLDAGALTVRVDPDANTIAWLIWHLARVQDEHVAEIAGREQAWTADGWAHRLGMDPDPENTGYGHSSEEVAAVRPADPQLLMDYLDSVLARTHEYLASVDGDDLDRIIDQSYDPPVSVAVRLVSVLSDNLQHGGQAGYVRGIIERMDR